MKKTALLATLVLFFAAGASASIVNTAHDLSSSSSATFKSTNVDEICVFCHTPHAASIDVSNAPLWNRPGITALGAEDLYAGSSLSTHSKPETVLAAVNASDAPLCLSCHDGSSMADAILVNPPNYNNAGVALDEDGSGITYSGTGEITGFANLFVDKAGTTTQKLKDDHPIGMNYASVAGDGTGAFHGKAATGLRFFGTDGEIMWCASCHDVHTHDKGKPFLAADNSGSKLCLACHNK